MDPQTRAQTCARLMMARDAASRGIGARIDAVGPGHATMSMLVQPHMLNGHGICHGGFIFTLADSAFAFACNSYNRNTVAQSNQITYLAPAHAGERLTAQAIEISRSGRSGVYDVTVTGDSDRRIALFRGHSREINGQHFSEDAET